MWEHFTEKARAAIWSANNLARQMNSVELSPLHILIGLLSDDSNVAMILLRDLEITVKLSDVVIPTDNKKNIPLHEVIPYSKTAVQIIEIAYQEARNFNHSYIGTEHLLLGVLETGDATSQFLQKTGLKIDTLRQAIISMSRI